MKFLLFTLSFVVIGASAFTTTTTTFNNNVQVSTTALNGYVPSGMTAEQYKKLQAKENAQKAKKKFGAFGPQGFQSRSLQAFQTDMERGKAGHLLPMMNAADRIKRGEIRKEDVPYMQRGGSWDNSDVSGARNKLKANEVDKRYGAAVAPAQQQAQAQQQTKKLWGLWP